MRLTRRRWATAFAIAVLVHAGVLAVGLWHGSDPGAGVSGPAAISVALSQAGRAAPSAAARPSSGLPEAETVAAVETAVSNSIVEAVRKEVPATVPLVMEAASAQEPTPPVTTRAVHAEIAAHEVAPDDAAAVEMSVVETAATDPPATSLRAPAVRARTPAHDVAPNDAASVEAAPQAAVAETPESEIIATSATAAEMPTVESAASPLPEPAREATALPETSQTVAIARAEAVASPAQVETMETVIRQAGSPGIPEPESTTDEIPETGTTAVSDAVSEPPIAEAVSASPERVVPARRPSDTDEEAIVAEVNPAVELDPPDAEAKRVETAEEPQSQRRIAVAAVGPGEEDAAEGMSSSPPSTDSDADRSAPPSAVGASARLQRVGIKSIHDEYLRKVLRRIARFKRYPREARRDGAVGKVMVRFSILADGSLRSPQLTDSSGDSRLDRAALEMLSRASPFPPIPAGLGAGKLELSLPIEYSLSEKRRLF